jgi:hypothetical protein
MANQPGVSYAKGVFSQLTDRAVDMYIDHYRFGAAGQSSGLSNIYPKSYSLVLVVFPTDDTVYYPLEPFRPGKDQTAGRGSKSSSAKKVPLKSLTSL